MCLIKNSVITMKISQCLELWDTEKYSQNELQKFKIL